MPTVKRFLSNGSYHHVYNRGVEKRTTFLSDRYYHHFLDLVAYYIFDQKLPYSDFTGLPVENRPNPPGSGARRVTVLAYCLMPNHFHLLLRQEKDLGIRQFVSEVTNGYTKHFNIKNKRVGNLFQGTFKSKEIDSQESLWQVTRYIHANPALSTRTRWKKKLELYPYSSHKNYLKKTSDRIIQAAETRKLLGLENAEEYQKFVEGRVNEQQFRLTSEFLFPHPKSWAEIKARSQP